MTSSVVVSSPSATASKPEPDPATLAAVVALGVPEAQVPRLIAGKSAATVRQAVRAVAGYLAKKPGNAARLFTVAIREGWTPSAPPSDAPSDHGERPVRIVRAPKEYLERLTATAPEAPRMPQEAPQGSGGADHPTGGREAFRATVQRLRGNTAHA